MTGIELTLIDELDDCPEPDSTMVQSVRTALNAMSDSARSMHKNAAPAEWEGDEAELANHLMTKTAARVDSAIGGLTVGLIALSRYVRVIDNDLKPHHKNLVGTKATVESEARDLRAMSADADELSSSIKSAIIAHNQKVRDLNARTARWNKQLKSEQNVLVRALGNADSLDDGRGIAKAMSDAGYSVSAPPKTPKKDDGSFLSGLGHTVLDLAGLVPVIGEPADAVNALWYELTGDHLNAGLSAAGLVPFLGWGATGGKLGGKATDLLKLGDDVPGPGAWREVNESMSERAKDYQKQITGREPNEVYRVDDVKFDGFRDGALQDAKGPGYKQFVDKHGEFYDWFRGKESLLSQARRQTDAAGGTPITWSVAEKKAADAIEDMLREEGFRNIHVVHVPAQ